MVIYNSLSDIFIVFFCSRFYPHFKVLDYSGGKEKREELREDLIAQVLSQGVGWAKAKFPFHIMLAHYEVQLVKVLVPECIQMLC